MNADVKPDRRIEAGLLGQHQVRQLVAEILRVVAGLEIAAVRAPIGDGVHHAMDQLADATLAFRRPQFAVKVFADDDVGGRLGPFGRHLHVILLEYDGALIVTDGGGAELPGDLVVRGLVKLQLLGEVFRKADALALVGRKSFLDDRLQFRNPVGEIDCE